MILVMRPERAGDEAAIHAVTEEAFRGQPHSDGSEPRIVDELRRNRDLAISLVTQAEARIVGHIAFSPVTISDGSANWYGLGPVSVLPELQRRQIGAQLIQHGLARMQDRGAAGVVLLGNPEFYRRFGFAHDPALVFPGPPAEYFQRLILAGEPPSGTVRYAAAFG